MIKYSRAGTASIPHERVFKLDSNNLVCIYILHLLAMCLWGPPRGFGEQGNLPFYFWELGT